MGLVKNTITRGLWELSQKSFGMRSLLRPLGIRTDTSFYAGRTGSMQLPNGKVLKLTSLDQNYVSFELHWKGWGYYEPIYLLLFREVLRDQDIFFDIGGNMGYYTLAAHSFSPGLSIHSFEPNPKMNGILSANLEANGFDRVELNDVAVSDQVGTQTFYLPESDFSGTLDPDFNAGERTVEQKVKTSTLDAYVGGLSIEGRMLMKVDVEGHEPSVIAGAMETISKHKPDIIMEVTADYGQDLTERLHELGYGIYDLTLDGFQKCDSLDVHKEGGHYFLNRYLTTRDESQLDEIYGRIKKELDTVDLDQSSFAQA